MKCWLFLRQYGMFTVSMASHTLSALIPSFAFKAQLYNHPYRCIPEKDFVCVDTGIRCFLGMYALGQGT